MGVVEDCSHWPNALDFSFANGRLMQALEAGGYTEIGAIFYVPHEGASTFSGADDVEYRRRAEQGRTSPVYASADGSIVAELDTRFGADSMWLCSLLSDGSVFWTKNALSRQPQMGLTQEQERDLAALHPQTAMVLRSIIGGLGRLFDGPRERVGAYPLAREWVTEVPELHLTDLESAHRAVVARHGRGAEPMSAEVAVLVAATRRSSAVARFHEKLILISVSSVGGAVALATAVQLVRWSGSWVSAVCLLLGLLLVSAVAVVAASVVLLRLGSRIAGWLPGPWRRPGAVMVEAARASPPIEAPQWAGRPVGKLRV